MKTIIIIGGGFAGAKCAKDLQNKFNVILIDNKNYFEFTPSVLRVLVHPEHANKIESLHKNYLKKAEIIIENVKEIDKEYVYLKNKKIKFDYLIITSGSQYKLPFKQKNCIMNMRSHNLKKYNSKIKDSKKILIIGGGVVGVEIASEIVEKYNNKNITIVQNNNELMPRNNNKTKENKKTYLEKNNIKLIFNNKIIDSKNNTYYFNDGKKINTDLAFYCTGIKPNYDFMKKTFSKYINKNHFVDVNEYLQLKDHKNIFIGGDIANINEEKLAQNAEKHAEIICKNIINLEKNKLLKKYKSKKRIMVISLGEKIGIAEYKKYSLIGKIPAIMKKFIEYKTMKNYK
ncbi:FAD-dependent oxidoreductase [Candidatus Woesearchaeota archaeon]|nr:FAD-dependent oxidoreductase [Candidatus Woesearchaeota archaeon]